jgi:DNA-binding transcriptional LysR family regulator
MWSGWAAIDPAASAGRPVLGFDTFITAMAAAEAGAGVLLGSRPLIDQVLDQRRLVRLSALELPSASGHFVTHAAGTALEPAQDAVLHWLLRQAAEVVR